MKRVLSLFVCAVALLVLLLTVNVFGAENTVALDDDFVPNMAQKVVNYLNAPSEQVLSSGFSWTEAASRELQELTLCLSTRILRPKA